MEITIVTDKDIFEKVKDHLIKQGFKSADQQGACLYRGFDPKTLKEITDDCIAKHDDVFDADLEDLILDALWSTEPTAMCAVGCLIKDEEYSSELEHNSIDGVVEEAVIQSNPNWNYAIASRIMLSTLQQIHDTFDVSHWDNLLRIISNCFDGSGNFDLTAYEANNIEKYRKNQLEEELSKW